MSNELDNAKEAFRNGLLQLVKSATEKRAFTATPAPAPPMTGAPPMDPAMAGGMPPGAPMDPAMAGGMPMDPAMMGGAPPMDPSMGGMPPMDPAAMGGMPPADPAAMGGAAPAVDETALIDLANSVTGMADTMDKTQKSVDMLAERLLRIEENQSKVNDSLAQPAGFGQ